MNATVANASGHVITPMMISPPIGGT
jgi:hypothetical protein